MDERMYWLGFSFFRGIGPAKFELLLEKFWTAENAWNATELELKHSGIGEKLTQKFLTFRKDFDIQVYARQLQKSNIHFLILTDANYPNLLKQIEHAPFVLYVKGNLELMQQTEDKKYVAVVGTRKITEYGKQVTETLTEALSSAGCVVVSGLAMGVDAVAHAATLRAKGKTIAVLGCGVDCCTPRENQRLYDQIITEGGAIVSEAPLGQMSFIGSFPARNRIIAGLSEGVLVTEGAEDSGSLITANDALKNNRMVFAVPGPITSTVSRGPISLISKGANMVTTAQDVLDVLGISSVNKEKIIARGDTPEEQKVLDLLLNQRLQFDEIVRTLGMHTSQVGILLSLMEMKGLIKRSDQEGYCLAEI